MPPPYKRHVFVCVNERPPGHPRGDCSSKGSPALVSALKVEVARHGLKVDVRINKSGCLDNCELGPSIVVYPEGVWYGQVRLEDVPELVESHLRDGRPVERLRLRLAEPETPPPLAER